MYYIYRTFFFETGKSAISRRTETYFRLSLVFSGETSNNLKYVCALRLVFNLRGERR